MGVRRKIRSQSQQLFSQGMSLSLADLPELIRGGNQRCGSQEKDNSRKRIFWWVPIALTREVSQLHLSRAAGNVGQQNAALFSDNRCKLGLIGELLKLYLCAVAPLMRNRGGSPVSKREGRQKSVKLKLTESKNNMRHRHELPHRRQMIFLREGEQFIGENSGRQYENPKGKLGREK
ncbi:hypothetical protein OPV22_002171 [Ensete ventricosum]|uniref:Uncharacterized protein n=1 Tax=Ensete ventricosum TaxID=4639 RepID=A0AAV8RX59_ENSVE|nr:hypothetical protein OPV22_002171 [Ensete ventricosum]